MKKKRKGYNFGNDSRDKRDNLSVEGGRKMLWQVYKMERRFYIAESEKMEGEIDIEGWETD